MHRRFGGGECAGRIVTAIDIHPRALEVARENAGRHGVAERIRFLEGDLFAPLPSGEQFDIIVSNPPYVADGEMETLPADIRLHEPAIGTAGRPEGTGRHRAPDLRRPQTPGSRRDAAP